MKYMRERNLSICITLIAIHKYPLMHISSSKRIYFLSYKNSSRNSRFGRDFRGRRKTVTARKQEYCLRKRTGISSFTWLRMDYTKPQSIYAFRGVLSLSLSIPLVMGSISARRVAFAGRRDVGKTAAEEAWGGKIFEHTLQMFALVLDIA